VPTAFTHLHLRVEQDSDSFPGLIWEGNDGFDFAGTVWRPPPGKRGAFLHDRLVSSAGHGVRVRRLGGDRAGEIRLSRFLRNAKVMPEEMVSNAAARIGERCADRHVLAI
jgi:hypothetical protein